MSDDDYEATREEAIESLERSAEVYGLSRSAGRVYGTLYFSEEPLSISDLVERTGYAKSTISNVTRRLTRVGMIRRRSSRGGGRRVRFAPEVDVWFVVQDVLQQYARREMRTTRRTFERLLREYEASDGSEARDEGERIEALVETYGDVQRLLELAADHSPAELIEAIEAYEERAE